MLIDLDRCQRQDVQAVSEVDLAVAAGEMKYEALLAWVREHRI